MWILIKFLLVSFLLLGLLVGYDLKLDLIGITFLYLTLQNFTILIWSSRKMVNLITVYFIFSLVFLSILPWMHYTSGHVIWRATQIPDYIYISVNLIIFAANFIVFFFYLIGFENKSLKGSEVVRGDGAVGLLVILLFMSTLGFASTFFINNFSILQLLFRGLLDEQRAVVIESSSLELLFGMISRLTPVFCFYLASTSVAGFRVLKIILFLLMLLSVFPTGVPRYMAAFSYIPLILLYFPFMRNGFVFVLMLVVAIVFLFPFLDQFRNFSGIYDLRFVPGLEFFNEAHFDAYENFTSAFEASFVTNGFQLLGAVFFFVPRSIWLQKPVGSGYEMAERLGFQFNNISMPYLGEGYVNFGLPGVLVFSMLIGYLMAKIDSQFKYERVSVKAFPNYSVVIYYFAIGALFFVLRGDMLSSFAYTSAGLIVALLIHKITWTVYSWASKF